MTTLLFILAVIAGFALLIWGADRFIDGAANIARHYGVSPLIVGVSIVGFGTSAPEMMVSALAALDNLPALGIGNAIGSNIANVGLVLAITTLVVPLTVHQDTFKREFPILLAVMFVSVLLVWDANLNRFDGIVLFTGFILTLLGMTLLAMKERGENSELEKELDEEYKEPSLTKKQAIVYFMTGLVTLLIGSKLLVWGASGIAHLLGVSDLIIGLTIVAIGTSLPELSATIASALKNEHDIAIGNILGSNVFNILAVLAMPGLLAPSELDPLVLYRDFPVMIGLSLAVYAFARLSSEKRIGRLSGVLMLLVYIIYNSLLAYQSMG